MIPLNFYRDDEYVYYNNPNGITKKMTIADFESMMSNESELPEYSSSNQGEVLSVDSDGYLDWTSLPPAELPVYTSSDGGKVLAVNSVGTGVEWDEPQSGVPTYGSSDAGKVLAVNSGGTGTEWSVISENLIIEVSNTDSGMVLNKTYTEIHQAMVDGKIVFVINPIATGTDDDTYKFFGFVMETYFASGPPSDAYVVQILQLSEFGLTKLTFDADTVSDYPSWSF